MGPELRCYRAHRDLSRCGMTEGTVFRSRWYRGLEPGMEWLRLTLEADQPLQVQVWAADAPAGAVAPAAGEPALQRTANDLSLYGVRGQYLSFSVQPAAALRNYTLFFPGRSIAEGLPAILQKDEELRRLLAVCQAGYLDLNRVMRHFPDRLDPHAPDALPDLARWVGASRWAADETTLRRILPYAVLLTRLRGTRRGLILLTRLVTGRSARILETPGRSPAVTILLPVSVSAVDAQRLRALLQDFIPLGLTFDLIALQDGGPMDGHTYLEENAVLTEEASCTLLDAHDDGLVILE